MSVILYALLFAHFNAYKQYYGKIGVTFAIAYAMKRIVRSAGNKDHSDLVGLGGYALTVGEMVKLFSAVKKNSFSGSNSNETNEIIGGMLGNIIDSITGIFTE